MTLPVYLTFHIIDHAQLTPGEQRAILALCSRAYGEDFAPFLASYRHNTHLLLYAHGKLAAHGCWEQRALQQDGYPPLRTAYIEGIATEPAFQRQGHARAVLRAIEQQVWDYDLIALCAGVEGFYERLGWEAWRGPTAIRTAHGPVATPDEPVMIKRTGRTPAWIDLDAPLSAEWRDAPEQW